MQHQPQAIPAGRNTFAGYWDAGYGAHLLPIVPPGAPISPASRSLEADKLGKTPAKLTPSGYVGFRRWPLHETTRAEAVLWDREGAHATHPPSIALQGRAFPAFDLDINDPLLSGAIRAAVVGVLGPAPARYTTDPATGQPGARSAIFYRSSVPLVSWQVKLRHLTTGEECLVEFKADKAQVLVEGLHRKGGRYIYPDGVDLVAWGAANLVEISQGQAENLKNAIALIARNHGYATISGRGGHASWGVADHRPPVSAPSIEHVQVALAAAPNSPDIDRDEWVKVAHNIKGACLGLEEDGFELFATWAEELNPFENIEALWTGIGNLRTGWPELARWAERRSKGLFKADPTEFENDNGGLRHEAIEEMFATQLWVENQERVFDMRDQRLRNRQQFNSHFAAIGKPSQKGKCAWDVFMNEPDKPTPLHATARRQTVLDMTYLPGEGLLVGEGAERRVNLWRPALGIPEVHVSDRDVQPWLDHLALIIPDPTVRAQFLDWMASVLQRQNEKPNHGVVIGGRHGIGKSMLIEPLRVALGLHNVQEILASELDSSYSGWLAQAKLFVVEEMMNFKKKEMMQRLKTYLAAPPHTLHVNPKYGKQFTIPNLVAGIFFTNHEDAVALEPGERRFFVIWSDAEEQPPTYFAALARWYKDGGAALAARWLWLRDTASYNMLGEAPYTTAREDMRKSARSKLDELIESSIEECRWPLSADLVAVDDIRAWISRHDLGPHGAPTAARVAKALKDAGAVAAHPNERRPAIGSRPPGYDCPEPDCAKKQARLVAVRNHEKYVGMSNSELVAAFWDQRQAAFEELKAEVE